MHPTLNRDIFCNNNIPGWVKRADKRSNNCQASVMKATAGMIELCDNLPKAEKQNYVVNTKDLISLAMESIKLRSSHQRRSMKKGILRHFASGRLLLNARTCKFLHE